MDFMTGRNAIWYYTQSAPQPILTPAPKLSVGTGHTGGGTVPGYSVGTPGFVSAPDYNAQPFGYAPGNDARFTRLLNRELDITGDDGLHALNPTYRAHEFTVANYTQGHYRMAPYWQRQYFPPDFRNLLERQQVARYRVFSNTYAPRVLDRSAYFLGYQTDPTTAAQIGGFNGLGAMGSQ